MKIVIDISEETYKMCRRLLGDADEIERAIANGKPYEERPTGTWIYDGHNPTDTDTIFRCSVCCREIHTTIDKLFDYPFCHCGADMRGGRE